MVGSGGMLQGLNSKMQNPEREAWGTGGFSLGALLREIGSEEQGLLCVGAGQGVTPDPLSASGRCGAGVGAVLPGQHPRVPPIGPLFLLPWKECLEQGMACHRCWDAASSTTPSQQHTSSPWEEVLAPVRGVTGVGKVVQHPVH